MLYLRQCFVEALGEGFGLTPLGSDLAGVGEVVIVGGTRCLSRAQLGQPRDELVTLLLEPGADVDGGCIRCHVASLALVMDLGARVG